MLVEACSKMNMINFALLTRLILGGVRIGGGLSGRGGGAPFLSETSNHIFKNSFRRI